MPATPRSTFRVSTEVAVLAVVAIAFPLLFALAILAAGLAVALAVGHFALFLLKGLWILLFPLFAALRGLWRTPGGYFGEPLIASQAPDLFALIERLRAASNAGRVHGVYVTGSVNASMSQIPRYGIFGGTRNELHVGLPLMAAMDEAHFTAVLAHEIGHLARRHGSFAARIYAMRRTLDVMLVSLDRGRSPLVYLVALFYRWFAPHFERASLTLSRAVEFEADAEAAEAVGQRVAAEALVVTYGIQSYCDAAVWPSIFERVTHDPEPPADVYALIGERFRSPLADGHRFVAAALAAETDAGDTHPALVERLQHLGVDPSALEPVLDGYAVGDRSAADVFLAGAGIQRRALANEWRTEVRSEWDRAHVERRRLQERLQELEALGGAANADQTREHALVAAQLERDDATSLLVRASDALPGDAELALRAGVALAQRDAEEALTYFERAGAADPRAALAADELARDFFARRNDAERAAEYEGRARTRRAALHAAADERLEFTGAEPIEAHGLNDDELVTVRKALDLADLEAAYLARRTLVHVAEIPHFVLGVARRRSKYGTSDANIAAIVRKDLEAFPFGVTVIVSSSSGNRVIAALRAVEGTQLRV